MDKDKITGSLAEEMKALSQEEEIPVIVKYREDVISARGFIVRGVEPTYHYKMLRAAAMKAKVKDIEALDQDPAIERIWPDLPVHTCLDFSVPLVKAPQVWTAGYRGRGIKIAIVDTGIDPNHPDLAGRIAATAHFIGSSFLDDNGHGTHVAGIAAGSAAASGGKYQGIAPEATLYIAKALDANGEGMMSGVMAGIEWAVEQRVHVIGLSLGGEGPCDGTDALSETCDVAVETGYVVCVAAGNAGPGAGTVGPPGCAQRVITVGASTDNDQVTSFSSRGPTSDGRVKPDLLFPGADIISCRAGGTSKGRVINEYYTELSGTSMATPHAVGAAALLLEAKPGLTPVEVKDLLMKTAVDLGLAPNTQGSGRADIHRAYLGEEEPLPPPPSGEGCWELIRQLFLGK